jgi:hypothetical protein
VSVESALLLSVLAIVPGGLLGVWLAVRVLPASSVEGMARLPLGPATAFLVVVSLGLGTGLWATGATTPAAAYTVSTVLLVTVLGALRWLVRGEHLNA